MSASRSLEVHGKDGDKVFDQTVQQTINSERMPEEWRRSVLIPIYKNKGDAQCCGNYGGIKLMSHTMKIWERIIEARLRDRVEISKQQYGFMPGKRTTDAMFALRMLMEKYREGQRQLHSHPKMLCRDHAGPARASRGTTRARGQIGTRTDLAAGAAVVPHGFTARVSCSSNYLCKKLFFKIIKNISLLACFNF